jgi:phage-related protein
MEEEKPVYWVGTSKDDLLKMPNDVVDVFGHSIWLVQIGDYPSIAKPLKGLKGTYELRERYNKDTYRVVYIANLKDAVYVLHSFKKKSKTGNATPKQEINLVKERWKQAIEHSKERSRK